MKCEDVLQACSAIVDLDTITNLTDGMKEAIVSGVHDIKSAVATVVYEYYTIHDFEPSPETIPVMREVVGCVLGVEV